MSGPQLRIGNAKESSASKSHRLPDAQGIPCVASLLERERRHKGLTKRLHLGVVPQHVTVALAFPLLLLLATRPLLAAGEPVPQLEHRREVHPASHRAQRAIEDPVPPDALLSAGSVSAPSLSLSPSALLPSVLVVGERDDGIVADGMSGAGD